MYKWVKLVLALTVLLLAFIVAVSVTSALQTKLMSVNVESAADRPSDFKDLYAAVEHGDLASNQFKTGMDSGDASKYSFVTYTVSLSSFCPLSANWATLSLSPLPGDVAIVQGEPQDVPAFGGRTVTVTLLTENAYARQERTVWVDYYVFGRPHAVTVSAAAA